VIQRAGIAGIGDCQSGGLGDIADHHLHGILIGLKNMRRGRVAGHAGGSHGGGFNVDAGSWNCVDEFATRAGRELYGGRRRRAGQRQAGLRRRAGAR
jgi:hypothetical protein